MLLGGMTAPLVLTGLVAARDSFWQGDTSSTWNVTTNWYTVGAPSGGAFVPQVASSINARAIIGTDNPNGAPNSYDAAFGSPVVTSQLPSPKDVIGGLYFGLRQLDYTYNPPVFVNDDPGAGALVGAMTISAGTLTCNSTAEAGTGADGRIVVGADGRGYLTMTGGQLIGQSLEVDGEEYTGDALGSSLLDLSGSATLNINNTASASSGVANLNRRLRIEGPNVTFTTSGQVKFGSDSTFDAVLTGPTTHAMIQSAGAIRMDGTLNVEFSGAGATGHSVGDTWDLLDSAVGLSDKSFSNVGFGGQITVAGLPSDPPTGAAYYLHKVDGGGGHRLLQLSYDGVLVLHVNRDTGELAVTNPQGGTIEIDAYTIRSALGSMKNTYDGISDAASPPDSGWEKPYNGLSEPLNSANYLTEWKQTGTYDVSGIGSAGFSLGDGFDRLAVGSDVANFGTDGEDLIFEYSAPDGGLIRGQVVYEGTPFENNLLLRVNPNTGEATLQNDSLETLTFDGYAVLSSTGALSGTSWTGLGGDWDQTPASADSLTETNLVGALTLAPGQEVSIGDISASGFTTDAAQDGLSMQFILAESLVSGAAPGDYNEDGAVDAADYTVWRDSLGQSITLPNENPDATTPGVVDDEDYDFWKAQFGATAGPTAETEFRVGSVLFDDTLGSGSGSLAVSAVPEPGTGLLLLTGLGALLWIGRRSIRRRSVDTLAVQGLAEQIGGDNMARQFGWYAAALLAICATATMVTPARATTQGISLTNYDFELPGPVDTKTIAFDETGAPLDNIPGWTFPGPGVEDYGHEDHAGGDALGDSGTEGGGNPGNEMILSTFDGVAYQTTSFSVENVPSTQAYRLTFDAHNIYTVLNDGHPDYDDPQTQLTARLYFLQSNGTTRTTIGSPLVIDNVDQVENYSLDILGGSGDLTPALGRPLGVEFDVTSDVYNPTWVQHSWIGIDNVILQIAGVLAGDLDGDGDVDLTDYDTIRIHQQQSLLYNFEGEMTGDSLVDLNDFRAFKTAYEAANGGSGSLAAALAAVPEPSTLVLAMLLVGAVAWVKRGRLALPARLAVLAMLGLAVAAAPASADLLFYDPFLVGTSPASGEYTVGALAGQNPTAPYGTQPDFFTGAWTLNGTAAPNGQVKDAPGLSFIGAPAEGGSAGAVEDPETFVGDMRVGRYIKEEDRFTDTSVGTYYISWLQNFGAIGTNAADPMGFRTVEMWSDTGTVGVDNTAVAFVGYNAYYSSFSEPLGSQQKNAATARMTFALGTPGSLTHQIIDNSPDNFTVDTGTHLVVVKFVLSDVEDSDSVSLFLDPTSAVEPALPNASFTEQNITLGAMGVSQFGGAGGGYNSFDEIRVADAWGDVLPPFPLPGDTDNDGDVDLDDYTNIVTHMNLAVSTALEGDVAKADGSQGSDGRVTIADFRIWKDHYPYPGAGAGTLVGSEVPEPASWVLLLVAAALVVGRCRRQC